MNIAIPYRQEAHNGIELRYALRSIERYLSGYDDIILIGEKFPKWLRNVSFIHQSEESIKTPNNIILKMMRVANDLPNFIRWDDDIFLTKPLNVSGIKYWYDGNLANAISRHHGSYKDIIINTALKFTESEKFYDIHAPMIIHRGPLRLAAQLDWSKRLLTKTTYCHYAQVDGEPLEDCKIHGPHSKEDIKKRIGLFFSTSPQAICPTMEEVFNELYPEKSKYEI